MCYNLSFNIRSFKKGRPKAPFLYYSALPYGYCLFAPQPEQKLPVFFVPQEHTHSPAGLGEPQLEQNLPVFVVPQEQVQLVFSGFLEPQPEQKLPVFTVPQEHFHPLAA